MRVDMSKRTALVTGAASGIGAAVARTLCAAGAAVALADLDLNKARTVASDLAASGGSAEAFIVDVTTRESINALEGAVTDVLGRCDVIVNVAGWNIGQPFLDNDLDFIDRVIALNLAGQLHVCQTFLRPLVAAGTPGHVVNVASDAGRVGSLGETTYAAAKGGVIAMTKSLAREMARHNINVNCVSPGPTDTPLFRMQPPKIQEALIRAIPFRRLGQPEDVAAAVAFLASDQASYITGQVLSVSGGLTMVG